MLSTDGTYNDSHLFLPASLIFLAISINFHIIQHKCTNTSTQCSSIYIYPYAVCKCVCLCMWTMLIAFSLFARRLCIRFLYNAHICYYYCHCSSHHISIQKIHYSEFFEGLPVNGIKEKQQATSKCESEKE